MPHTWVFSISILFVSILAHITICNHLIYVQFLEFTLCLLFSFGLFAGPDPELQGKVWDLPIKFRAPGRTPVT